jgi:hypothetical protein
LRDPQTEQAVRFGTAHLIGQQLPTKTIQPPPESGVVTIS